MARPTVRADVCVVGAGYAGLAAARRLAAAGLSVAVLEARSRVGGRVWTRQVDGLALDVGGAFLGPGQDEVHALVRELGLRTHPTHDDGDSVLVARGRVHRFPGLVPRINPLVVASVALAMARLDAMARSVPLDAPWDARRAERWDRISVAAWAQVGVPVGAGREMLDAAVRGLMTCDPSEVSLLHWLFLIRSGGGLQRLLATEGGYQQDHVVGGAQTMADQLAAELGDALHVDAPVRSITLEPSPPAGAVRVRADRLEVRADRVVMATPPALAARIDIDPPPAPDRVALLGRLPAGSVIKILAVYPTPFWRADGLSGASAAPLASIEATLDTSPGDESGPGVLTALSFGPPARGLAVLSPERRRALVLEELSVRFGRPATRPLHYVEQDWAAEQWSRGCYMAHMAPGVLTQYGRVLRAPAGRIHWAGTETATKSHGTIDGAIRSGYRAADEVIGST